METTKNTATSVALGVVVGTLLVVWGLGLSGVPTLAAPRATASPPPPGQTVAPSVVPSSYAMTLNNTPIYGSSALLNNTTAHPWGETYASTTHCLYVTENPTVRPTMGYVTALGPLSAPVSYPIWNGDNPQGIAWGQFYLGEPASYRGLYRGGILTVADTGNGALSVFGIMNVTTTRTCGVLQLLQTDYLPNFSTGGLLATPVDVVFARSDALFYTTWELSNMVTATAGSTLLCETNSSLGNPTGLSYDGLGGPTSAIAVANFEANGWVTVFTHLLPSSPCGLVTSSPHILDRSVWTTFAPGLNGTNSIRGTVNRTKVIAVSDSNYGIGGNLLGTGCPTGTPLVHVTAFLKPVAGLPCSSSVALDAAGSPNPGAYGITYAPLTGHVYEVLSALNQLEAVTYSAVSPPQSTGGTGPIEVIWFLPAPGTTSLTPAPPPSPTPYFNHPTGDGTLVVTDWTSGNLYFSDAF